MRACQTKEYVEIAHIPIAQLVRELVIILGSVDSNPAPSTDGI